MLNCVYFEKLNGNDKILVNDAFNLHLKYEEFGFRGWVVVDLTSELNQLFEENFNCTEIIL